MQRQAEERDSYVVEKTRELPLSFIEGFGWGSYMQAEMLAPAANKAGHGGGMNSFGELLGLYYKIQDRGISGARVTGWQDATAVWALFLEALPLGTPDIREACLRKETKNKRWL